MSAPSCALRGTGCLRIFGDTVRGLSGLGRLFCVLSVVAGLSACTIVEEPEYIERPVADIYNNALDLLNNTDFKAAAREFDEVERQHPYSVWATKSQLMAAYAYYQSNRYDDAIIALDRFTQLHPAHRDAAYAYYLKAQKAKAISLIY